MIVAIALSAVSGCKEKSKGERKAAEVVAAIEGISALPASIDAVLGADVPTLAKSELVDHAIQRMYLADPGLRKALDQLFEGCGFEPGRDLRTVLVGMDVDGAAIAGAERTLLVASGKLSEGSVASCVTRHLTSIGGALVQKPVGGRTHYHADSPAGQQDVWFAFGSKDTVVVSSTAELLADALGKGPRLVSDEAFAALVERARRPGAAIWAAGLLPPEIAKGLATATGGAIEAPRAIFGHLAADTGLALEIGVELASAEEANSSVLLAKQQLAVIAQIAQKWKLGQLVAKIEVKAAGPTLFLNLALDDAELATVLAPIDTTRPGEQTTAPQEAQGASDGEGDAAPGGKTPVPEQGQAD